jgi:hypothetical protein
MLFCNDTNSFSSYQESFIPFWFLIDGSVYGQCSHDNADVDKHIRDSRDGGSAAVLALTLVGRLIVAALLGRSP